MVERTKLDEDLSGIPCRPDLISQYDWNPDVSRRPVVKTLEEAHLAVLSSLVIIIQAAVNAPMGCIRERQLLSDAEKTSQQHTTLQIEQFWDTICYDRTDGGYKCQLDEQWFNLTKDTLRDALQITPVNNNKAFSSPPTQDTLINFVNDLGYPKEVKHLSNVVTNDMFQPWRALTTIINLCLTGKTSGFERPRAPVLQILWGIINRAHIDYAERMWEEFTQSIHTFTEDKKNLAQNTQGKKKATLIVIPSVRFTKLIIFHLQRKHKFHPRPESPLHLPTEEPILGYLKFSAKGTKREVFGMPIPNELITDDIRGADYYDAYLEKVAKHQRYLAVEDVSWSLEADTQRAIEESLKDAHGAPRGPLPPVVFRETDTGKFQPLPEEEGKGKEKVGAEQAAQGGGNRTSVPTEPSGHDESSSLYVALGLTESDMESDEEMPPIVKSGDQDEGQARPDPGIHDKGQAGPNPDDVAESLPISTPGVHAGPNLEHTDVEATDATMSQHTWGTMDRRISPLMHTLNVLENLKLIVDEPVIPEEPASSTGTLSSLQHLAKDFSFGDQFFNDKPSEADMRDNNKYKKPENQWCPSQSSRPSSFPSYDIPPQQGSLDSILINRLGELEQHITDLVDANQALEERLDKHGSRLYRLENQDIPNQVSKAVDEIVTDAVDWAMHAPLRERFRDLPEADMKEILHNRMKKKKKRQGSPKTPPGSPPHPPPPSPPPTGPSGTSRSFGASGSSQSPPPPPPPSNNQGGQSTSTAAPSSSKTAASTEYTAWTMTDTSLKPSVSSIPEELHMDDDTTADKQAYSSSGEDIGRDHIPTVNVIIFCYKVSLL
ncbi:hypothetical protein Tco_0393613 [Tanacetum coccineum]